MAFDVIFSVRDGCGDHKNNFFKAFPRNFSVILTNSSFVSFLAYDVTLRHSYPVTILFSDRCNALFGKNITCSLLKTQQMRNNYKALWEMNKRVKIWWSVRSYPRCPKLPRLTVQFYVTSSRFSSVWRQKLWSSKKTLHQESLIWRQMLQEHRFFGRTWRQMMPSSRKDTIVAWENQ